jgi:hypothetical protein
MQPVSTLNLLQLSEYTSVLKTVVRAIGHIKTAMHYGPQNDKNSDFLGQLSGENVKSL